MKKKKTLDKKTIDKIIKLLVETKVIRTKNK